ncbi:uncharacterized protein DS421_1g22330 [Arachis hypogaea]|nr:uncharacterized protein DS421_1g22330 [Arachis hypogaea]
MRSFLTTSPTIQCNTSTRTNKNGDRESPCLIPLSILNGLDGDSLIKTDIDAVLTHSCTHTLHL